MTYTIDKNTSHKEIVKIFKMVNKKKKNKFDPKKYCGSIISGKDALLIQKELRNEWK